MHAVHFPGAALPSQFSSAFSRSVNITLSTFSNGFLTFVNQFWIVGGRNLDSYLNTFFCPPLDTVVFTVKKLQTPTPFQLKVKRSFGWEDKRLQETETNQIAYDIALRDWEPLSTLLEPFSTFRIHVYIKKIYIVQCFDIFLQTHESVT